MTVSTTPLWRIRLARELPRLLLCGASVAGLLASARFLIAPPRPAAVARARFQAPPRDLAAEGFAQLFARRYLTWDAADPEAHQRALAQFVGPGMEPDAGLLPPATDPSSGGEEQVQWTEVVQERLALPGEHVYTVAAQTDTAGLEYLTVAVVRASDGALELGGYPAFVGAPASAPAPVDDEPREVSSSDPTLHTVVERALRNYLADAGTELAADLRSGARVSPPARALSLEAMQRLDWSPDGGGAVSALVQAQDDRGVRYTLSYELDVSRVADRWEVSAIQMDPDT